MRNLLAVLIAKITIFVSRALGKKGSALPGAIALKISPDVLRYLSLKVKKDIVAVCGTNGKTTTNNMLYTVLKQNETVCNNVGSNMIEGICAAFISKCSWSGRLSADYACLEIDEAWAAPVFDHIRPSYILITNLFPDQLDRYGSIDAVIGLLNKAIDKCPDATVVLNGDDPLSAAFSKNNNRIIYFGIDEDTKNPQTKTHSKEICQLCGQTIDYNYRQYSQMGDYYCDGCGYKRPDLNFAAHNIRTVKSGTLSFVVCADGKNHAINLNYRGLHNVYNATAAFAAAYSMGIDNIGSLLEQYTPRLGRMETFYIGKPVVLNLAKNPAGFNQTLATLSQDKKSKNILVAINDKTEDGKDISWLQEVEFEMLSEVKYCVASGSRREDVALKLSHDRLDSECMPLRDGIISLIRMPSDVCYVLVNYTVLFEAQEILRNLEKLWKKGKFATK